MVAWVVQYALADHGKALARRTAEDDIDFVRTKTAGCAELSAREINYTRANGLGSGEVVFVYRTVNGVDFNSRSYIETGLLETKRQAAGTGKKVNTNGAVRLSGYSAHTVFIPPTPAHF
jgi:hypothetical protein